jgi:hypothetical protein
MREFRLAASGITAFTAGAAALSLLTACTSGSTPAGATPEASDSPTATTPDPRGQLALRAAAAKDRRYVVGYKLSAPNQADRSVLVTVATDGSWRVDIQGGALSGTANVAIASRPEGQYQCTLDATAVCVKVAEAGKKLPVAVDPHTQYPFTTWLNVLTDRDVAITVTAAGALPGSAGTCYSVNPAVTAVQPPIDAGVFCYTDDGTLTAAKLPWGTFTMVGQPSPPPPTVVLPGPVTPGQPLPTSAPPAPPAAPTGSPSGSAKATPTH